MDKLFQSFLLWLMEWVGWIAGGVFSFIGIVILIRYFLGRLFPSRREIEYWSRKKNDDD